MATRQTERRGETGVRMIFQRFFTPRPQVSAGRALFAAASEKARDPAFYEEGGVPDTPEGRFELYTLHVILLLRQLRGDAAPVVETRQALFDALVRNLDDGLREMGVGDLSVGKKMRKLGAAVYGRLKSYDGAIAGGESESLAAVIRRTVFAGAVTGDAEAIARYVTAADTRFAAAPVADFLHGAASWPSFPV
jgi:cytochrome b pre-mRNA-processing protein 3